MDIVDPFDQPTAKRGIVDPFDAPTPVNLMGPMAADAAAIKPFAAADPNAPSIAKAMQGATDVGSTLASRLTPAAMLPMIAGGAAGIGSLASEKPVGNGLADMFLPAPVKMGMALANPDAVSRAADAVTSTEEPLNYQPQTQAGKVAAAVPDYVFNKIGQGADYLGQKTTDVTGSPLAGAGVSTAAQLLPLLLGERSVRGGIGTAKAVRAGDLSRGDQSIPASIDTDMAGITDRASLSDMLTKGATDPQAPTPADGLKTMLDQVKTTIAQGLAPKPNEPESAPVQPPPPAVAAGLKAVTGGDPQKMAAVIQGAVGDKLKPGETPENLAAQAAKEPPNAANRPLATEPGGGGEGTGVDSAPNSPEAAARSAVLAEKPDAAPPLHPWTPVDTTKPIPLAGGVVEPEVPGGPQKVAIDPRIPQFVKVDGKDIDAHEAIGLHERTEKTLMEQGLDYADAHDLATKAENAFVEKKYGIDPQKYQDSLKPHISNALKEASNDPNIPPTLDQKPYTDEGDEGLLKNDSDLTDVRNQYLKGLADEIGWDQEGGRLIREATPEDIESAVVNRFATMPNAAELDRAITGFGDKVHGTGDVIGRTTWEAKGRQDGNGVSWFWQNYKAKEGTNGLTIAGAKEALRKHLDGEKLTPKEKRFADFAEDQATKYMGEYAEEKAAGDTLGRQDSKEQTQPPTDYSDYTKDYTKGDEAGGFTPQERHASRLDSLLSKLGPITDEQKAAITAHHGSVETDPVMGLPTRKELVPTIEAAKAEGGPASYGEVDIRGVGSLNAHMGSNSAADPHLKAIAQIVQRNVDDAANAFGGRGVVVRKGGDELGVIAHGVDPADLHRALGRARKEVDAYAKQHGLDKAKSAKVGGQDGVGLHYGVSRITPDGDIGSIIGKADRLVEARKKGQENYEYTGQIEKVGAGAPGGQAGRTGESAGGGDSSRPGAGTALSDSALQGEPTGTETAVAERPVTKAANPPPTKPVETATSAEPEKATGTSPRNAATDADRERYGLDELEPAEREHWENPLAEAQAKIAADPSYPEHLAREVAAKPRPLTTTEEAALTVDLKRLDDEHATATQAIVDAQSAGDTNAEVRARIQRQGVLGAIDRNHEALRKGGSESARSLAFRNAILKDDYSLGRNMSRVKAASSRYFNADMQKEVEDLSAKLKEQDEIIASLRRKKQVDANTRMQAKLTKDIADMEAKLAKRLKVCPI